MFRDTARLCLSMKEAYGGVYRDKYVRCFFVCRFQGKIFIAFEPAGTFIPNIKKPLKRGSVYFLSRLLQ